MDAFQRRPTPVADASARRARGRVALRRAGVRCRGNQLIDIDFSLQPLRDEHHEVVFLVLSASVITERKHIEQALRESNEKFQQLAAHLTHAFWIRSADMREVHYISPAFERIWARSPQTLYAHPAQWVDFTLPEDRERVQTLRGAHGGRTKCGD